MYVNFQQGIIAYPIISNIQTFLAPTGDYVSLSTVNGRVDITLSHGTENYLVTESDDVINAWGPLTDSTDTWLYWDINLRTGIRTFGTTEVQPVYSSSSPSSPVEGMHWFNTSSKKMYAYATGSFREVVRVFAAKVNNLELTPLGAGVSGKPFAGSQAGLTVSNVAAGRILFDSDGKPVKRANGTFFTSETLFFINGSPVNTVRLEQGVVRATAAENLGQFQIVKYSDFDEVVSAGYSDLGTELIAIALTSCVSGDTTDVCLQGLITNSNWSWSVVGAYLWINDLGLLTESDLHVVNANAYPVAKTPIARVVSATSVKFMPV